MKRESGVLMHISSLYGEYSCGSFGKEAEEFVDFLEKCGFTWWQVLPFCMADECNSPYKSYSAFGGNPNFINLDILKGKGYLTEKEIALAKQETPYICEYKRLSEERILLLSKAAERVMGTEVEEEIKEFISDHKEIADFCLFMAKKTANKGLPWNRWITEEISEKVLFTWQFIQYEFFSQWKKIKEYANKKGIKILGDIPIYVSYDSADVWANKELFQLDEKGNMQNVAGVPPDYFCSDGQLWGNPLYRWDKMENDGYYWWCRRLNAMFELFDGVRIDHFRGIESYWSVDANSKTAKNGVWKQGPGKKFVDKINSIKGNKLIVAEDLGIITPEVEKLVEYSGMPGMRVMQFGFDDDGDSTHLPHNYPKNVVAYTGTHDNNTLLGFVWELSEEKRRRMLMYCGYDRDDWDNCYESIIRTLFASSAGIAILPVQDLLGFGSDTRLNTPGEADGNWQFRVTKEQIAQINTEKYKCLNNLYKR